MEDAQINQDEQPMYQAPEYPSVVDTDDIIYELGKQVVDNLNKEKLLKIAAQKIQTAQNTINNATHIVEGLKAINQKLADELETLKNPTDEEVFEATITQDVEPIPEKTTKKAKKTKSPQFL